MRIEHGRHHLFGNLSSNKISKQSITCAKLLEREASHIDNDTKRLSDQRHIASEMSDFDILRIEVDRLRREARCMRDIEKTILQNF